MANWKYRAAIFGAGLIALVSGPACTANSSSNADDLDSESQTTSQDVEATPDWSRERIPGPIESVSIGVGCGRQADIRIREAHLNEEGFVVIPGAIATVSSIVGEDVSTDHPAPAEQMFYKTDDVDGAFVRSYIEDDTLNDKFNDPDLDSIYMGDQNGIGDSNSGLSLSYFPNIPGGDSNPSVPAFVFSVDYYGGAMGANIPDGDAATLDRDASAYAGSTMYPTPPSVSNFVDPVNAQFQGNLMDYNLPGEPFLEPVEVSQDGVYQKHLDLPKIPGEVVAAVTAPVNNSGQDFVCASAAIIPPPIELSLA